MMLTAASICSSYGQAMHLRRAMARFQLFSFFVFCVVFYFFIFFSILFYNFFVLFPLLNGIYTRSTLHNKLRFNLSMFKMFNCHALPPFFLIYFYLNVLIVFCGFVMIFFCIFSKVAGVANYTLVALIYKT